MKFWTRKTKSVPLWLRYLRRNYRYRFPPLHKFAHSPSDWSQLLEKHTFIVFSLILKFHLIFRGGLRGTFFGVRRDRDRHSPLAFFRLARFGTRGGRRGPESPARFLIAPSVSVTSTSSDIRCRGRCWLRWQHPSCSLHVRFLTFRQVPSK